MRTTIIHLEGDGAEAALRAVIDLFGLAPGALVLASPPSPGAGHSMAPSPPSVPQPLDPSVPRSLDASSPIDHIKPNDILDCCPPSMAELPAFFDRLTDQQLDTAWVACLIDCAVGVGGRVEISQLAAACNAVRARYRSASLQAPGDRAGGRAGSGGRAFQTASPAAWHTGNRNWPAMLADLLKCCPEVGDQIELRKFASVSEGATLRQRLLYKHDDERFEWVRGEGQKHPAIIRRVRP